MDKFKNKKDVGEANGFIKNEGGMEALARLNGKIRGIIKTEKPKEEFLRKAEDIFEDAKNFGMRSLSPTQEELEAVALTLQKCEKTPKTVAESAEFIAFWEMCGKNTWREAMEKSKKE